MPRTPIAYRTAAKQLALLAAPLIALFGWILVVAAESPLDVIDFEIEASQLHSLSVEANKLAEDLLAGQTTEDYFDVHARMLFDKVADARSKLQSREPRAGLESSHRDVTELARQLSATTRLLSHSLHDRSSLRKVAGDLTHMGSAAEALERNLATVQ